MPKLIEATELKNVRLAFVSLVPKGANGIKFTWKDNQEKTNKEKSVEIKKQIKEKRLVTGIVYEPDVPDSDNEYMTAEEIEKAAHGFMINSQNMDAYHEGVKVGVVIVESYIEKSTNSEYPLGSWIMSAKIIDDVLWERVKSGELKSFSWAGMVEYGEKAKLESQWYDNQGNRIDVFEKSKEEIVSVYDKIKEARKDFNTVVENTKNNDIYQKIWQLERSIDEAIWEDKLAGESLKKRVIKNINQFKKSVEEMTFEYKSKKEVDPIVPEDIKVQILKEAMDELTEDEDKQGLIKSFLNRFFKKNINKQEAELMDAKEEIINSIKEMLTPIVSDIQDLKETVKGLEKDEKKEEKATVKTDDGADNPERQEVEKSEEKETDKSEERFTGIEASIKALTGAIEAISKSVELIGEKRNVSHSGDGDGVIKSEKKYVDPDGLTVPVI